MPKILRIYLEPHLLKTARAGEFGFGNRVRAAFEARGFRVDFVRDTDAERLKSATRKGYALFVMKDPFHSKALSMRKAYYFPYWRIEATDKRWAFEVAKKTFDSAEIDPDIAQAWFTRWQRNLFKRGPQNAERTGMIYVPLQGKLLDHRSFQSMSPVDMVTAVQDWAGERKILLGLHPNEDYSPEEISAVEAIADGDPRVTLKTGGMEEALRLCDCVVTENSTAALSGLFFEKPAVLFAQSDFHHQMPQVSQLGVQDALRALEEGQPDYAKYLYWFIQMNSIKADTDEADAQIIDSVTRKGWIV
ncbi:MAG: hypothetical protein P8X50_15620 [Maritimibacter sp.]